MNRRDEEPSARGLQKHARLLLSVRMRKNRTLPGRRAAKAAPAFRKSEACRRSLEKHSEKRESAGTRFRKADAMHRCACSGMLRLPQEYAPAHSASMKAGRRTGRDRSLSLAIPPRSGDRAAPCGGRGTEAGKTAPATSAAPRAADILRFLRATMRQGSGAAEQERNIRRLPAGQRGEYPHSE